MKKLFFVLLASVVLASCTKDNEGNKDITLTGGTTTSQTVYADETSKTDGIKFNASAPWTATVKEIATRAGGSDAEWLQLSAYDGNAGEQTLTLTLLPNTTGADRRAEIRIICGGTTITIVVEQKGTTQSGGAPDIKAFLSPNGQVVGGEIFGQIIWKTSKLSWHISKLYETDDDDGSDYIYSPSPYIYENNTFRMTLPTPPANCQGGFLPGVTATPSDAKFSSCEIEGVDLTDIPWTEYNIYGGKVKKGQGRVMFIYASKAATVNGTFSNPEDNSTIAKFVNCQFRQGWNEVILVASAENNSINEGSYEVVMNKATNSYKWVSTNYMQTGIIDKIDETVKTINRPGTSAQSQSTGSSTHSFVYDNMTRVSQFKNAEGQAAMSIQYNSNNVVFTPSAGTSDIYPLNSAGYISSAVLPNGTGKVEYKYDDEGYMTEAVVTDNINIGGTTKKYKEVIEVREASLWYQRYIDFNDNNVFDDSERVAFESTNYSYGHLMEVDIYERPNINFMLFNITSSIANGITTGSFRHISGLMGVAKPKSAWPLEVITRYNSRPYDKNGILNERYDLINQCETKFEYGYTLGVVTAVNITGSMNRINPDTQEVIETMTSFEKKLKLTYKPSWQ